MSIAQSLGHAAMHQSSLCLWLRLVYMQQQKQSMCILVPLVPFCNFLEGCTFLEFLPKAAFIEFIETIGLQLACMGKLMI